MASKVPQLGNALFHLVFISIAMGCAKDSGDGATAKNTVNSASQWRRATDRFRAEVEAERRKQGRDLVSEEESSGSANSQPFLVATEKQLLFFVSESPKTTYSLVSTREKDFDSVSPDAEAGWEPLYLKPGEYYVKVTTPGGRWRIAVFDTF